MKTFKCCPKYICLIIETSLINSRPPRKTGFTPRWLNACLNMILASKVFGFNPFFLGDLHLCNIECVIKCGYFCKLASLINL